MKEKLFKIYSSFREILVGEELSIYHRLQNIILFIACLGAIFSLTLSMFIYDNIIAIISNIICVFLTMVMLYVSAVLKKGDMASILLVITTDVILFPMMYVYNGGYNSGMIIWFTLGMIFPWIILKGRSCVIMCIVSILVSFGCITYQLFYPEKIVVPVSEQAAVIDFAQSMLAVTLIVGAIFKYQTFIYEKQRIQMAQKDSDLHTAIEGLKHETDAKSSFLAQMSHEIRTPINAVLGMDEMILRESDDPTVTEYADNIRSAGQSLLSIINDILDFSKIESGRLEIVPVNYDINDIIDYCHRLIDIRAREKDLAFRIIKQEGLPDVLYGDEVRIRQIFVNLLTNAVKYTSSGFVEMKLNYTVSESDSSMITLICQVQDTGKGIDKESQKKLFDSFIRVDEKENRNIEGTGLGLAITKQLTELMDGTISVNSEKGIGSVFSVTIPQTVVARKSEASAAAEAEKKSKAAGGNVYAPEARILVVDDVKMNIDVFKGLLKRTSAHIDAAYSGMECLEYMKNGSYDLVFMDHLMPEMDGVETLNNLRELSDETGKNVGVPVIALTANAMSGAAEEYMSLGFNDYLSKPVKSAELEQMLLKHLPADLLSEKKTASQKSGKYSSGKHTSSSVFVDIAAGMAHCSGDEELYHQVAELFCSVPFSDKLNHFYAEKNWDSYLSCLYRLASSSQCAGAVSAADYANSLAEAVRNGDTGFVSDNHGRFIKHYESAVKEVRKMLRA